MLTLKRCKRGWDVAQCVNEREHDVGRAKQQASNNSIKLQAAGDSSVSEVTVNQISTGGE